MNKESTLYVVIFSLIITFVLVLPLSVVNELTKARVEQNKQVAQAYSILVALGLPADKKEPQKVISDYAALEKFKLADNKLVPVSNDEIEQAAKSGFPIQQLFYRGQTPNGLAWGGAFTGPGLWGNLTLALGFDEHIQKITGFQAIAQVETPGLGARIAEPWFTNQFTGQKIPDSGELKFVPGSGEGDADKTNDSVDTVTGATITSHGTRDIVDKAIAEMRTLTAGGVQ